jgi:hypothetical protein
VAAALCAAATVTLVTGCSPSSVSGSGPLFEGGGGGTLCGPVSLFADAAVVQPLELRSKGQARITGVKLSGVHNATVSKVGVGPAEALPLLAPNKKDQLPHWARFHNAYRLTSSRPGDAVAMIHVVDRRKDASVGPFLIDYSIGTSRYETEGLLRYHITLRPCNK